MLSTNKSQLPPGYTGHLPFRNDIVGMTSGEATKLSLATYDLNRNPNTFAMPTTQKPFDNITPMEYYK